MTFGSGLAVGMALNRARRAARHSAGYDETLEAFKRVAAKIAIERAKAVRAGKTSEVQRADLKIKLLKEIFKEL